MASGPLPAAVHQAPASGLVPGRVELLVEAGMQIGRTYPLTAGQSLVGRSDGSHVPEVDLSAQDPDCVHRKHALLAFQSGRLYVTDLGGSNKTFLNGRSLPPQVAHEVNAGDRVRFGKVSVRIRSS